ncbi:MAG: hypothetical protein QGI68_08250 [Pseudomonadales bacterium]|nr:hypothetical protein [Pseudomonadales bacterium]MDP7595547.1 hypothetical protein [Pseudomonadales bacterium]
MPLILSVTLSAVFLSALLLRELDGQADDFGQTTAELLAVSSEEYLIAGDLLSLNVLLSELVTKGHFSHASIYSADSHLLAEAGNSTWGEDREYTAEIHYQESIAGHLRITLAHTEQSSAWTITIIIVSNLLLIAIVALLVHRSGDQILTFLNRLQSQDNGTHVGDMAQHHSGAQSPTEHDATACRFSVLVIRLKPVRVALQLKHVMNQAISLYNGDIIHQTDDEVVVVYTADTDHCFQAICTDLVIQSLADDHFPGLELGAGIHCGGDLDDQDAIKKHAIYLASLGYGNLLTSESVYFSGDVQKRVKISEFHSSLAPDSKVFAIESLQDDYQTLINRQAVQLNQSR